MNPRILMLIVCMSTLAQASYAEETTRIIAPCGAIQTFFAGQDASVMLNGDQFNVTVIGVNTQASPQIATLMINGAADSHAEGDEFDVGMLHVKVLDVAVVTQPVSGGAVQLELNNCTKNDVPEFSAIGTSLALLGSGIVLFLLRR